MKNHLNYIVLCFCLLMSVTLFGQVKKTKKLSTQDQAKVIRQLQTTQVMKVMTFSPRKMMPYRKNKIWVLGTSTIQGHWSKPASNEINTYYKNKQYYTYPNMSFGFGSYNNAHLKSRFSISNGITKKKGYKIPKKTFNINTIKEDLDWIHKKKIRAKNLVGTAGKTNVYYFKKIEKGFPITFTSAHNHIIVTDTLYAPIPIISTEREKRNYIKIIANCIVYESPIKPASLSRNKTDLVFSAKKIIFKSRYQKLQKKELTPTPPFVFNDGGMTQIHKDPYSGNESKLMNRLFIEIMNQITRELTQVDNDWEMDKLLIEFQKYKHKVKINLLYKDPDYNVKWGDVTNNFDSNQESAIERIRIVNGLKVMVEGKVKDLHKSPFKYFVIPSKATLVPVMDENTGVLNKLGDLLFSDSGDSKLSLTMGVKLGYQKELLAKANEELNKYGFTLERSIPKKTLFIDEQPLQIRGQTTGKIIPIDSDILELKLELQDEGLSLIKLLVKNDVSFDLNFKAYDSRNEFPQNTLFEVSDDIIKQIDYENMIGEFNVIQTNSITDWIKITSNLSSDLGEDAEGKLNYIEVSLEIHFDNEKVSFWGPYPMSSASVLGSEKSIPFVKYSDNYSIKVTGKAYYENGVREIKDNFIINSPFIELQEGMFKDN